MKVRTDFRYPHLSHSAIPKFCHRFVHTNERTVICSAGTDLEVGSEAVNGLSTFNPSI